MHTQDGIKERFVNDLSCVTDELLRQPRSKMEGRVKSSFSEKATKIWKKISHLFWRYWLKTAVLSIQMGDSSNCVAFS